MAHSFFAMVNRMKYINRWGLMRNSVPENLSEHTLEVAYITHGLAALRNSRFGGDLDCGKAVLYALYHDCSEIITGDLPTPVKYHNQTLKDAYKAVEAQAAQRLLEGLPEDLAEAFAPRFEPGGEYRLLVKAADKISALIKCVEERKMGNRDFDTAYQSTLDALVEMEVPEAEIFLREFLPGYCMTLDDL